MYVSESVWNAAPGSPLAVAVGSPPAQAPSGGASAPARDTPPAAAPLGARVGAGTRPSGHPTHLRRRRRSAPAPSSPTQKGTYKKLKHVQQIKKIKILLMS